MNPKVLIFDIETLPLLVYVWGIRDQYIAPNQIKEDWSVGAWSAKWLGAPASSIKYLDQRHAKYLRDDRAILKPLWRLLDEADIVITQNGKRFDARMLNARFIEHGMTPPSPYTHWDTLTVARHVAAFSSNKLEYLTEKLCTKYKKLKHTKYPGNDLWIECMAGNQNAWKEMQKYNIRDVLSTEELYTKIRAWAPQSTPAIHHVEEIGTKCKTCGTDGEMRKRGAAITKTGSRQRYQCGHCGAWFQGGKIEARRDSCSIKGGHANVSN